MNRAIFIDSNVLIDVATRRKHCSDLEKLMVLIRLGEVKAFISSSHVTDIYYILTQGSYKIDNPQVIYFLREIFSEIEIFPLSKAEITKALDATPRDFEDQCVFECAKSINAEFIITSNKKDFCNYNIQCGDACDFFAWLKKEKRMDYSFIRL